jgi:hypothetical protein
MEPFRTTPYTGPSRAAASYERTAVTPVPRNHAAPSSHRHERCEGEPGSHPGNGDREAASSDAGHEEPQAPLSRSGDDADDVAVRLVRGLLGKAGVFVDRRL